MSWETVPPAVPTQADGPTGSCVCSTGTFKEERGVATHRANDSYLAHNAGWSPMRHAVTVEGSINAKEGTRSWQVWGSSFRA